TGPIVVLVDHGSASASEIVSGAIQDLDRGLVAGTNTFGKGLVQNQFNLSDGSKLLLTIAKYYTPSGRLIQRDYSKFGDMTHYLAQRKDHKWTAAELAQNTFTMTPKDWESLHAAIDKEKVAMSDSLWQAEKPFMLRQVRVELAGATLGPIERYRVLIEEDTQ